MGRGSIAVLALAFASGCSSSYEPVRSPRIETVIDGGQPTFVKNGEHMGNLTWGTGLVDAVKGNPRAEHHARVGRNLVIGGVVLGVVGLGTEIGGLAVLAKDSSHTPDQDSSLGVAIVLTGAAVAVAGAVLMLSGQPHIYDAVNIYNDDLDHSAELRARTSLPSAPPRRRSR